MMNYLSTNTIRTTTELRRKALPITLLIASYQTIKATLMNPEKSLKTE